MGPRGFNKLRTELGPMIVTGFGSHFGAVLGHLGASGGALWGVLGGIWLVLWGLVEEKMQHHSAKTDLCKMCKKT